MTKRESDQILVAICFRILICDFQVQIQRPEGEK